MLGEYAGVRLMSNPPYPYRIAGRGPAGPEGSPLMISIRTRVPLADAYVTCRVATAGTDARPGAGAHVVTAELDASNRSTSGGVVLSVYPNHASCPPSGRSASPPALPSPGSGTLPSKEPLPRSCTVISLSACLVQEASKTARSSDGPSRIAYPWSTASGSSPISSRQLKGSAGSPGPPDPIGSRGRVTARRPRGAPRSVNTYSSPSRPARTHVSASTPSTNARRSGEAGSDSYRSASHRSFRGAVPRDAETISHRPSQLTDTE